MTQPNESAARKTKRSRPWLVFVTLGVLLVFVVPGVAAWMKYSKPRPRFHLTLAPASNQAYPGWAETWQVKVTPTGGYKGTIRFSTAGLPASVRAVFTNSVQITNGKSKTTTLIIDTSSSSSPTAQGTTKFRVFGTTSLNRSSRAGARGTLVVARFPAKSYTLELKARGGSTVPAKGKKQGTLQYDVSVNRSGKKDKIKFAVPTNLPAGIKASFKPQTSSGNATVLTFSNSSKKPVALWPFTVSGTSGNYNIDVYKQYVPASRLSFATQPAVGANIAATGSGSFPVVVRVVDANGKLVASDNSTQVTLAIATNPAGGALSCTGGLTAIASGGSASFNACAITKAGNGYTLNASSTPSFSAPTNANAFNIVAGSAAAISLGGSNADLTVGASRPFTATIRDTNGNVIATGSDSTASVSFTKSSGSGSISGSGASAASGGVAAKSVTGGSPGAVTVVAQATLNGGPKTSNGIVFNVVSGGAVALPYNITATVPNPMYPGATAQTIPVTFNSPNVGDGGTRVSSLTIAIGTVTGNGGGPIGCSAADFQIAQVNSLAYPFYVPGGTSSLSGLIASGYLPTIKMLDLPQNQDDCKTATVTLTFAGTP